MRFIKLILMGVLVTGCTISRGPAPVEDRRPAASRPAAKAAPKAPPVAAAPVAAESYVVKRGDTLYSIALEHGHDYRDIAQWNSLEDPTKIRVGQVLRLTPPPQQAAAQQQQGGVQLGTGRAPGKIESRPLEGKPPTTPAPVAATPSPPPQAPASEQPVQFMWPAKGKLLAGFAEPRQKGIDIGGKVGDPVLAAAAGRVTYVGTGIPGLGKLVVIKHDQGFITVYAHNKDILVKEQQSVARGQRIAELGEKLHFQIRKGASAVDPLLYLPKS